MLGKLATMCIVVLLLAGIVIAAWGTFGMTSPLTLSIGSGPIALVQNGPVVSTSAGQITATLPSPSTAGNTLILIVCNYLIGGGGGPTAPLTFTQGVSSIVNAGNPDGQSECGIYSMANNLGGVSTITASYSPNPTPTMSFAHLSEWSNVAVNSTTPSITYWTSTLDFTAGALGYETLTAGTTTAPTINTKALTGDLVIVAWVQFLAGTSTATFTTPANYVRLIDNGAVSGRAHLDIEYWINPNPMSTGLSALMSSNQTTASGVSVIMAFAATFPPVDMTAYLKYD